MGRMMAPAWHAVLLWAMAFLLSACGQTAPQQAAGTQGQPAAPAPIKPRILRVGTEASYPPMEFVDDKGNIVGYDIDLLKAIAQEAGIEVEFQNMGWDALFGSLQNGAVDVLISSITITEERKKTMTFSDPYYRSGQRLVVARDSRLTSPSLENMSGRTVGVQVGTTGAELVQKRFPAVKTRAYDNVIFGFKDLAAGNIDGFVTDDPVARYYASRTDGGKELVLVGVEYTSEEYGIAVRPGDTELLKSINDGLRRVREKGIDAKLREKWLR